MESFYNTAEMKSCGIIHPDILEEIREYCKKTGTTCLDPFAGSGVATLELGELVRRTDRTPWSGIVKREDAIKAIESSEENEQTLILMFPPPQSNVPYEVLKRAAPCGFKRVYIIQESLEPGHCGDELYVDLVEKLNPVDTECHEYPIIPMGFHSTVWKIELESEL